MMSNKWRQKFIRWKYVLLTFRDHAARLNRSVEVENVLLACAAGRRGPLTPEECRDLAHRLGVSRPLNFQRRHLPLSGDWPSADPK